MCEYQTVNETSFNKETNLKVIQVLENARKNHFRIKLFYGDIETGRDWGAINDIVGYVGRSNGNFKIPILLYNSKSIWGGSILDDCIVKIEYANKKNGGILYQHPKYFKVVD